MGNCLRRDGSPAQWGGEEWDFLAAADGRDRTEGLLDGGGGFTAAARGAREVKIKMTRKQLEELLGKVDIKEMCVEEVLRQLISVGDGHHRAWRPVLQSIPEGD